LPAGKTVSFWASSASNWYSTPYAGSQNTILTFTPTTDVSPANYDLWAPSSGQGVLAMQRTAGTAQLGGTIFSCGACTAVANSTTETSLFTGAAGVVGSLTIPAGTLVAGNLLRINIYGAWGYTATPALALRVKLGGTTILQTTSSMTPNSGTGASFAAYTPITLNVLTTGSSGTIGGFAQLSFVTTTTVFAPILVVGANGAGGAGSSVTIDTTGSLALDVTAQWNAASASNTMTLLYAALELVN
jgi:hypothetical protein